MSVGEARPDETEGLGVRKNRRVTEFSLLGSQAGITGQGQGDARQRTLGPDPQRPVVRLRGSLPSSANRSSTNGRCMAVSASGASDVSGAMRFPKIWPLTDCI